MGAAADGAISLSPGGAPFFSVPDVIDFSPSGFDMTGMRVTAHFSDGTSVFTDTVFWQATSAVGGHAVGSSIAGWSVEESGDTFDLTSVWYVFNNNPDNLTLTKLVIEGSGSDFGGKTLFDVQGDGSDGNGTTPGRDPSASLAPPHKGTAGSELGSSFEDLNGDALSDNYDDFVSGGSLTVSANYANAVKLDSAAGPVGDLFTTLEISFGGSGLLAAAVLGLPPDSPYYMFRADTDLWGQGEITQNPSTPEPSSFVLLAGLGLFAGRCFRRKALSQSAAV